MTTARALARVRGAVSPAEGLTSAAGAADTRGMSSHVGRRYRTDVGPGGGAVVRVLLTGVVAGAAWLAWLAATAPLPLP